MRRNELVPNVETAIFIIQSGRHLMHEKTILSASQLKTWKIGKLIEKVSERKMWTVREDNHV